ncbi:MAG: hypothetical protein ACRDTJ_22615 [Pseudonocardiaceae bacterium]
MNDPWADALAAADAAPPKITAHQVSRIVGLIADYTTTEADALIHTLVVRQCTPGQPCSWCNQVGNQHSRTCPAQGDRHD